MLRSVCSVWLLTYRGAFVISLNVFDWKACNILALDGLLQPHSSIPSVHIGFSMVLYSSSAFSTDSWEVRPISQQYFLTHKLSC
jgi:hypothetical protein